MSTRRLWFAMLGGLVLAALAVGLILRRPALIERAQAQVDAMQTGPFQRTAAAMLAWLAAGAASSQAPTTALPPPPPTVIGMNVAELRYYSSGVPFANLLIGSEWMDTAWKRLTAEQVDAAGNIVAMPADGIAHRFLLMPQTGPEGVEVRCTFTGSGSLSIGGSPTPGTSGPHSLRFRLVSRHGATNAPWIILRGVDVRDPPRDLDCRDARLERSVRFRPEFLATLRGYRVIRFMEWQNSNANEAVPWLERHTPGAIDLYRDGVSIEDMLAMARELDASPWFSVPWNADADYIRRFASLVRDRLPADRSVYVEVGNEVWNPGFPVSKQAAKEGIERKLATDENQARILRYAQRTAEVMPLWEAAFRGRSGLVRVMATQQVWPQTAQWALGFPGTAAHVDALATSAYFGATLGGTDTTRDLAFQRLSGELAAMLRQVADNRRIAIAHGKRYIAYEAGQGLTLPAQVDLSDRLQRDPAMGELYRRFLTGWQRESGDVLALYNNVQRPNSWGSWGLVTWEDEAPGDAPKLRAVRDALGPARP